MPSSYVEIGGAQRKLQEVGRQAPFALALALTSLASDAKAAVEATLPQRFDRPAPFTSRAVGTVPATKTLPVAQVFVKDEQAKYLAIQERGGLRQPEPGVPVILPVAIPLNVYGNIPRGRVRRERQKPEAFVAAAEDARTRHLAPGIWRRYKRARGKARPPKLLVAFHRRARYAPRFGFVATVLRTVAREAPRRLREALATALATMRY